MRIIITLLLLLAVTIPVGCAPTPGVDDARIDFRNELEIFKDLCAAAMDDGRRAGMLDASESTGYRAGEFAAGWNRRNAVAATPLSTANKASVIDCGIRGYDIGFNQE